MSGGPQILRRHLLGRHHPTMLAQRSLRTGLLGISKRGTDPRNDPPPWSTGVVAHRCLERRARRGPEQGLRSSQLGGSDRWQCSLQRLRRRRRSARYQRHVYVGRRVAMTRYFVGILQRRSERSSPMTFRSLSRARWLDHDLSTRDRLSTRSDRAGAGAVCVRDAALNGAFLRSLLHDRELWAA